MRKLSVRSLKLDHSDCRLDSGTGQVSSLAAMDPAVRKPPLRQVWRGQDSNLRSPEGRRVYSPLPLSTRPPLLIAIGESPIPVRSAVLLLPVHPTFLENSLIAREDTGSATLYALRWTVSNTNWDGLKPPAGTRGSGLAERESWRRESNPQPTDYKSVALPLSYASSERCGRRGTAGGNTITLQGCRRSLSPKARR